MYWFDFHTKEILTELKESMGDEFNNSKLLIKCFRTGNYSSAATFLVRSDWGKKNSKKAWEMLKILRQDQIQYSNKPDDMYDGRIEMIKKDYWKISKRAKKRFNMTKKDRAKNIFKDILSMDNYIYYKKNGRYNVAKMSRISGLSRSFISRELWKRGLL